MSRIARWSLVLSSATLLLGTGTLADGKGSVKPGDPQDVGEPDVGMQHREFLDDPPLPAPAWQPRWPPLPPVVFARDGDYSVQVNVDEFGGNIPGDAANEPSIAVDPTNPNRIAIGWRQFDTVHSNFRQAGWGYSRDAGRTWTFPGVLEPGVFRSDPVLDADADGGFYYYSLKEDFTCQLFRSSDGGITWTDPAFAWGATSRGWRSTVPVGLEMATSTRCGRAPITHAGSRGRWTAATHSMILCRFREAPGAG